MPVGKWGKLNSRKILQWKWGKQVKWSAQLDILSNGKLCPAFIQPGQSLYSKEVSIVNYQRNCKTAMIWQFIDRVSTPNEHCSKELDLNWIVITFPNGHLLHKSRIFVFVLQSNAPIKGGRGGSRQHFWEDQFWALGTTGAPNDRGNFWWSFIYPNAQF